MNARWKKKISDRRGASSMVAGIVLALVFASICITVIFAAGLFQTGTAGGVNSSELTRERQLELLRSGVLSENTNGFFSFWVRNNGGIDVRLEGVALQYGGTTTFENFVGIVGDNYLLPGAYRVYNYPLDFIPDGLANSFTGIALATSRGNLFPIGGITPIEYTWITGQIIDNDNNDPLPGSVGGESHSDPLSFTAVADKNGQFKFLLPKSIEPGTHEYTLTITRPGYDNIVATGSVEKGYIAFEKVKMNFNPFSASISPASGSLTCEWIPSTVSTWEYDLNGPVAGDLNNVRLMGNWQYNAGRVTTNQTYYARVWVAETQFSDWGDYTANGTLVYPSDYLGHTFTASNGSAFGWVQWMGQPCTALTNISYTPIWVRTTGHYVTEQAGYRTLNGWIIMATADPYYLNFRGPESAYPGLTILQQSFPLSYGDYQQLSGGTTTQFYTDRGAFYRNDTTSYPTLAAWQSTQTTITAIPLNGYTGSANLVIVSDNALLSAVPAQNKLTFASPATTIMTVSPGANIIGLSHTVAIFAYNSDNRRLVVGGKSKPALLYNLGLTIPAQPSPFTNKYQLLTGLPDFSIGVSPSSGSVANGGSKSATVSVSQTGGTGSLVTLSVNSGLPAGATATFSPSSGIPNFNSTLTISTTSSTPAGTYTITIRGAGQGKIHDCTYTLTVTAPPDFTMSVSPTSGYIEFYYMYDPLSGGNWWTRVNNTSVTITITPLNGFSGNVTISESTASGNTIGFASIPKTVSVSSTYSFTTNVTTAQFAKYPPYQYSYETITFSAYNSSIGTRTATYVMSLNRTS